MAKIKFIVNPLNGELVPSLTEAEEVENIDGGSATSVYTTGQNINGGGAV
jgi:hypothetical protein